MKLFKIAPTNKYNSPEIIPILGDLSNILNTLAFPCKHIHIWMCFWVLLYLQGNCAEAGTQLRLSSWRSVHLPQLSEIGAQQFLTADLKRSAHSDSKVNLGILLWDFFLSSCFPYCSVYYDQHLHSFAFLTHPHSHLLTLLTSSLQGYLTLSINISLN